MSSWTWQSRFFLELHLGEFHDVKKHCISYPTESLIFCKLLLFFLIVISSFVHILSHFTLILLKLEHALITTELINQNLTKKVMLLYKKSCFNWFWDKIPPDKTPRTKSPWTKSPLGQNPWDKIPGFCPGGFVRGILS